MGKITVKICRYNPEMDKERWEEFKVQRPRSVRPHKPCIILNEKIGDLP